MEEGTPTHLWLTCLLSGLDLLGVALVIPFMPFLTKSLGISKTKYGSLMSLYNVTQIIGGFILGDIINFYPSKLLWIVSCVGSGFAYGLVGIATSVWHLVISRLTIGLVRHSTTVTNMIVSRSTSREDRATWIGRRSAFPRAFFLLGMAFAGNLSEMGVNLPFLAFGIYVAIVVILILFYPNDTPPKESTGEENRSRCDIGSSTFNTYKTVLVDIFKSTIFWRLFLIHVMTSFVTVGFRSMRHMYMMERYDIDMKGMGAMATVIGITDVFTNGVVVPYTNKLGPIPVMTIGLAGLGLMSAAEIMTSDVWIYLYILTPISSIFSTMFATNEKTLISLLCPPETLGGTLALLNVIDPINGVIAPIVMGFCLDKFGNLVLPMTKACIYAFSGCVALTPAFSKFAFNDENKKGK